MGTIRITDIYVHKILLYRESVLTEDINQAAYITATSDLLSKTAFYEQGVRVTPSKESVSFSLYL